MPFLDLIDSSFVTSTFFILGLNTYWTNIFFSNVRSWKSLGVLYRSSIKSYRPGGAKMQQLGAIQNKLLRRRNGFVGRIEHHPNRKFLLRNQQRETLQQKIRFRIEFVAFIVRLSVFFLTLIINHFAPNYNNKTVLNRAKSPSINNVISIYSSSILYKQKGWFACLFRVRTELLFANLFECLL